jgi:hypothetical protein
MKSLALISILLLAAIALYATAKQPDPPLSYWLWAGITPDAVPVNSELYIHQGHFEVRDEQTTFERHGLYPHPLKCSKLFLVYRIDGGLPDVKTILAVFNKNVRSWQRHPVTVTGIQLDFDSPTSKLLKYGKYLEDFRKQLPKEFALSVTGLGDWALSGNEDAMRRISSATDEIVFQLYQGREHLPDIERYVEALSDYRLPFRIGLIYGQETPDSVNRLRDNSHFRGTIYFIVKKI